MAVVLVTRPAEGARRTAERIRAMGHEALVAPVIEIRPRMPARLFAGAAPDHVVFTSAAAPAAIAEHGDLDRLRGARVWVVGRRTAEAAQAIGLDVHAVEPDFRHLVALMARELPPDEGILHLAGEDRTGDLAQVLERAVEITEVYRAAIVPALPCEAARCLAADGADAVMHFSRRSAAAFFDLSDRCGLGEHARRLAHLCIAAGVADMASAQGSRRVFVAAQPEEDAMIDLIAAHLR